MSAHQKRAGPATDVDACEHVRAMLRELFVQPTFYDALCTSAERYRPVRYETVFGQDSQPTLVTISWWVSAFALLRMVGTDIGGGDHENREQSLRCRDSFLKGVRLSSHDAGTTLCTVQLASITTTFNVMLTRTQGKKRVLTISVRQHTGNS